MSWITTKSGAERDSEFGRIKIVYEPIAYHNYKRKKRAYSWVAYDPTGRVWAHNYKEIEGVMRVVDRALENGAPQSEVEDKWVKGELSLFRFGRLPCHHCGNESMHDKSDGNILVSCCKVHASEPCPRHETDRECYVCTAVESTRYKGYAHCGHERCATVIDNVVHCISNEAVWYKIFDRKDREALNWSLGLAVDEDGVEYRLTELEGGEWRIEWTEGPRGPAGSTTNSDYNVCAGLAENWSAGLTLMQSNIRRNLERKSEALIEA